MLDEIWKPIDGYEGQYDISNHGRVRSNKTKRILKPFVNHGGYSIVTLSQCNVQKKLSVHRFVASAFVSNKRGYPQVNHIDGDPSNNSSSNLEWCTQKYNCNQKLHRERMAKSKMKPVIAFDKNTGELFKVFDSLKSAEAEGFKHSEISACCHGRKNSHYGYKWRFAI